MAAIMSMQHATAESWYETQRLADDVTLIFEPHMKPFYRCNIWHVRGRDRDMLVDSGMGVVSLSRHVELVTERPLLAVATHTHWDHIGSHHEFAERAVHPLEAAILASPTRQSSGAGNSVKTEKESDIFERLPPASYCAEAYEIAPAPPTRLLDDGDIVDLGDRHFEVLHLPGHSPGGIALWEAATGILFSGDVVYDGELLDDVIEDYVASMERLRRLPVRLVHGGHFPSFGGERYLELIDAYLRSKRGTTAATVEERPHVP
jgi:glyoxylase-like metal-dependent hydrolase (beta-lactamase superfamily II)